MEKYIKTVMILLQNVPVKYWVILTCTSNYENILNVSRYNKNKIKKIKEIKEKKLKICHLS